MARPVSSFQHLRIIREFGGVGLVVAGRIQTDVELKISLVELRLEMTDAGEKERREAEKSSGASLHELPC